MWDSVVQRQQFNDGPGISRYLVAVGSNRFFGELSPRKVVEAGVDRLAAKLGRPLRLSRLFATPCVPAGAGPDYVNAALELRCGLGPEDLLAALHAVEAEFDRQRTGRWASRTLDLDLLAADALVLPDPETHDAWRALPSEQQRIEAPDRLILPHPRLQDRGFVLVPLADVAPDWRHPRLGQTVQEMLATLPDAETRGIGAVQNTEIRVVNPPRDA